jgi:hypothetical protein
VNQAESAEAQFRTTQEYFARLIEDSRLAA